MEWPEGSCGQTPLLLPNCSPSKTHSKAPSPSVGKKIKTSAEQPQSEPRSEPPTSIAAGTGAVVPDGRTCKCCNVHDATIDYVMLALDPETTITIKWSKPPQLIQKVWRNDGNCCYGCNKLHASKYRGRFPSSDAWVNEQGRDLELLTEVKGLREAMIQKMVEQKTYNVRIYQRELDSVRRVLNIKERRVDIEGPKTHHIALNDYKRDHGDYRTNGLGHRRGICEGWMESSCLAQTCGSLRVSTLTSQPWRKLQMMGRWS